MNLIQNISQSASQQMTLTLADGSSVALTLYFREQQLGWFIESLVYNPVTSTYGPPSNYSGPFTIGCLRVSNSPNMLYQFKNQIPFGIACYSYQNREPTQVQDFLSGNSNLYLLSAAEVIQYSEFLSL